jgi:hypothetical protein
MAIGAKAGADCLAVQFLKCTAQCSFIDAVGGCQHLEQIGGTWPAGQLVLEPSHGLMALVVGSAIGSARTANHRFGGDRNRLGRPTDDGRAAGRERFDGVGEAGGVGGEVVLEG